EAVFKDFQPELNIHSSKLGMTWDEIRKLNSDPLVTIGAHTVNHFNLSKLPDDVLKAEILESKIELEKQLGQPVKHFAYPYGKFQHASVREFECADSIGFNTATTTNMSNLFMENGDMLCSLPRININQVTRVPVLKMQTSGLLPFLVNKGKKIIS
ncbi:polysaccharide deacetylase family protein, partial [Algibacter sp.]|uniref:polysaccharide deacetylase family protein n=1 Tax=Algibacter sp. TaxID=1872428 RepID=UPI003C7188B7